MTIATGDARPSASDYISKQVSTQLAGLNIDKSHIERLTKLAVLKWNQGSKAVDVLQDAISAGKKCKTKKGRKS